MESSKFSSYFASAEVFRFIENPRRCTYLPDQIACLEYRVFDDLGPAEFQWLLERGWRRFGNYCFRPACAACGECRSIRVDVADFRPSKSQRRTLARNRHIRVQWRPVQATQAHVDLLNAWQADMSRRKGWQPVVMTRDEYEQSFLGPPCAFGYEGRYFDGERLVGVGLVDRLPDGLSSVYFYHEPAWRPLAPGVYSVLQEIEFCRAHGLPHLYLGYWVAGCPSMSYKNQYRPYELLEGRPGDDEQPVWTPVRLPCGPPSQAIK
jgi:arginyl-tRNA--protein-N-Asp/Glu arginylyltransferase